MEHKETFNQKFRDRTKRFAVEVFNLCNAFSHKSNARTIIYQLIKSSSSVAANWRAACRARSENEFYAKVCIVVEEADETLFWLEFINDTGLDQSMEQKRLQSESNEILLIVSAIKSRNAPGTKTSPQK